MIKIKQELMWIATGYLIAKMGLIPDKTIEDFMKIIAAEYELKLKKYKDTKGKRANETSP